MFLSYLTVLFLLICSGYDFGYLIKILTNSNLPEEELDFFEILRLFFPVIYDVKYLMKSCKNLKVSNLLMIQSRLFFFFFVVGRILSVKSLSSVFWFSAFALITSIKQDCS